MSENGIVIIGLSSFSGVETSNNAVTISSAALGTKEVELRTDKDYSLSLGTDVTVSSATPEMWLINDESVGYSSGSISAGYFIDGKKIKYRESLESATFTLTGLNTDRLATYLNGKVEGIEVAGSEVKLSESVLNQTTVTLTTTDNFILSIDESLKGTLPHWEVSNGVAKYLTACKSGYILSSDTKVLEYSTAENQGEDIIISGLNSNAALSDIVVDGKTITIKNVSSDGATIETADSGYTFKLNSAGKIVYDGGAATLTGTGNGDTFINNGTSVSIYSGFGYDTVVNTADSVTVDVYSDNDSVTNSGNYVSISCGYGNDVVDNSGDYVTILGGEGNDKILNSGDKVSMQGSGGADSLTNTGNDVTINGYSGNNSIVNGGASVSVYGGSGNNTVDNSGDYVTIYGGTGSNSVSNSGNYTTYQIKAYSAEYTDSISGFNPAQDTLQVISSSRTLDHSISGDNTSIFVKSGSETRATIILESISGGSFKYKIADGEEQTYTIT